MWMMELLAAGAGAAVAVIWMMTIRRSTLQQRMEDAQELKAARQQAQAAMGQARCWQEAAHHRDVQLAYIQGMMAGRAHPELPPPERVPGDGRVYGYRPPTTDQN